MNENQVLTINDIEYLNNQLDTFSKTKTEYSNTIKRLLELFENQEIIQSFFQSGNFGQEQKDKLADIYDILKKYDEDFFSNENSLVLQTKQFLINKQNG